MAKLVDAPDLGSGVARRDGFESLFSHQQGNMAYLYCSNCGTPIKEFASILDVTNEFVEEAKKSHALVCKGIKLTTVPGNLYFDLQEVLRKGFT